MGQDHALGAQQVGLACDELGERALDRLAVDVAAPRSRQDRDVGPQVPEDSGPVARGVLVEQAAFGSVEQVHEGTAIPARTLRAGLQMAPDVVVETAQVPLQLPQTLLLLLVRDTEIANADLGRRPELPSRPYAGVLTGEDVNGDVVREPHLLSPRHGHELLQRNALRFHHAHRLVGADDGGARLQRNPLRAVEVVEVRVAHNDPIRTVDLRDRDSDGRRGRHAIDVGVEEHHQATDLQAKGRAAQPVE